uniref:HP domain-containing protein n=1 Tax=Timema tahoe TaxID=61484 RepID=A0A7R9IHW7_9NEOP|nr:unnamed protein product [Timema tahoe]
MAVPTSFQAYSMVSSLRSVPKPGYGLKSSTLPVAGRNGGPAGFAGDFSFSGMGDKTHSTEFSSGKSDTQNVLVWGVRTDRKRGQGVDPSWDEKGRGRLTQFLVAPSLRWTGGLCLPSRVFANKLSTTLSVQERFFFHHSSLALSFLLYIFLYLVHPPSFGSFNWSPAPYLFSCIRTSEFPPSSTFGAGLRYTVSYSPHLRRSLPNMSHPMSTEPAKIYPYHLLLITNYRLPADVDRLNLERHLSDAEFEAVLQCSRVDFYRMPQWRRNDLKRRVRLF